MPDPSVGSLNRRTPCALQIISNIRGWCQISSPITETVAALECNLLLIVVRPAQSLRGKICIVWLQPSPEHPRVSQEGLSDRQFCILAGTSTGKFASATKKCLQQHSTSYCSVITTCFPRRAAMTTTLASFSMLIRFFSLIPIDTSWCQKRFLATFYRLADALSPHPPPLNSVKN